MSTRDALIAHLLEHSVRTGDFTLKSGRKSTWFCDAKQTACRAEGILLVADAALAEIEALEAAAAADGVGPITAIGGLTAELTRWLSASPRWQPAVGGSFGRSASGRSPRTTGWRAVSLAPCCPVTGW